MEVHRYTSIVPLSFLHTTNEDTIISGRVIPKGATVMQNIYAVHNDPKQWKDPEKFDPDRFFDSNNKLMRPQCLMSFSIGKYMNVWGIFAEIAK